MNIEWLTFINSNATYELSSVGVIFLGLMVCCIVGFIYLFLFWLSQKCLSGNIFIQILRLCWYMIVNLIAIAIIIAGIGYIASYFPVTAPTDCMKYTYQITDESVIDFFENYEFVSYADGIITVKDK